MEDYEINDVRNRRSHLSPLITFEVWDWRRFYAAFDITNISDVVAEDVSFEFVPEIPWTDRGKPSLLAKGVRKFPPKQRFRFLYFSFPEILSGMKKVPGEFAVRISYSHPALGRRISDEWPVNFEAYRDSMAVRSEAEEQAKELIEGVQKIAQLLESLNKTLEKLAPIAGSTGLHLSIPALRALRRVVGESKDPEAIHPQGCEPPVIQEILGTDPIMTRSIWRTLGLNYEPKGLRAIPGMTDALLAKIRAAFVLEPDPDAPGSESDGSQ